MWRRYLASVVGFGAGALLAWLFGLQEKLVAVAGFIVAAAVMTFGEKWGLVPPSEEACKPQTLFSNERDKTLPRDTSGYLDSLDLDEFKSTVWERVGSMTYDRGRSKKRKRRARRPPNSPAEQLCAKCGLILELEDVQCIRCGTGRDDIKEQVGKGPSEARPR